MKLFQKIRVYYRLCQSLDAVKRKRGAAKERLYTGRLHYELFPHACLTEVFRKSSDMETAVSAMPMFVDECENFCAHYSICEKCGCEYSAYKKKYALAEKKYQKLKHDKKYFWAAQFGFMKKSNMK